MSHDGETLKFLDLGLHINTPYLEQQLKITLGYPKNMFQREFDNWSQRGDFRDTLYSDTHWHVVFILMFIADKPILR